MKNSIIIGIVFMSAVPTYAMEQVRQIKLELKDKVAVDHGLHMHLLFNEKHSSLDFVSMDDELRPVECSTCILDEKKLSPTLKNVRVSGFLEFNTSLLFMLYAQQARKRDTIVVGTYNRKNEQSETATISAKPNQKFVDAQLKIVGDKLTVVTVSKEKLSKQYIKALEATAITL